LREGGEGDGEEAKRMGERNTGSVYVMALVGNFYRNIIGKVRL